MSSAKAMQASESDHFSIAGYYIMGGAGLDDGSGKIVLTFGAKKGDPHYHVYFGEKTKAAMEYQLWYTDINGFVRSVAYPEYRFYEGWYGTIKALLCQSVCLS